MHKQHPLAPMLTRSYLSALALLKKSKRSTLFSIMSVLLLLVVAGGALLSISIVHQLAHAASPNTAVTTYKANNAHTGNYANETTLNTSNVNSSQFGKHVTYPVDGQVYAQPLFLPNLTINGTAHNVAFVETENNSIYAFDADQTSPVAPLWQRNLGPSVPWQDVSCTDMQPVEGITGTPVIDSSTNTMYVVAFTKQNGAWFDQLHALDITTGLDKSGSPVTIQGTVQGTGSGNVNGTLTFNSRFERQRGALVLSNGHIYVPFASFCDNGNYQGWIFSYSFSGSAFQQNVVFNDAPDGWGDGIWGAGGAITVDTNGNLFFQTGNGNFNANTTGGRNYGDSMVKLNPQLQVQDYFAPFNQSCLQQRDADLGSGAPLLLSNRIIGGGKEGRVYVIDPTNMGKYTVDPKLACGTAEENTTTIDKVLQEYPPATVGGIYNTPSYWNGPTGQYVFFSGVGDQTKAYALNNGVLAAAPSSHTAEYSGFTGGNPIVSSNGSTAGTGVLWNIDSTHTLRAYDATNLTSELYNTNQNASRDALDSYVKFEAPMVANGEVFVGTTDSLTIYGLLSAPATPVPTSGLTPTATTSPNGYNNVGITADTQTAPGRFDASDDSYSQQAIQQAGVNPGDNAFYGGSTGMVFTWPNALPGTPDNYIANGQTIAVSPLANANLLGFLGSSLNGPSSGVAVINYTDGTHQTFTLCFSDWLLNGGSSTPSCNNGVMLNLPYYNNSLGKVTGANYVFYADVAMQAGEVVSSVTLPTTVTGGAMHVFSVATRVVSTGTPTPTPTPTPPPTPTLPAYNNTGTSGDSAPKQGSFDGTNSYSTQALQSIGITPGNPVISNGATFTWPVAASGTLNNYQANGQVLPVTPVAGATTLAFLGAANNGPSSGIGTITYTDNSVQTFSLGFSDWTLGGYGTDAPSFGNVVVATTPYRNTPGGASAAHKPVVFYTDVALTAGKTIKSVTLPTAITGGPLHVFAVSTKGSGTATPPTVAYNNTGTSSDSAPQQGSFDGTNSYSTQALQAVGITPGNPVISNGATFTWPVAASGTLNNYQANGQVLPVTPVVGATTLAFLGAANNGPSSGIGTITYTDNSVQTFSLGFSDWTLGGYGTDAPSFGNVVVATTPYRNTPGGASAAHKPVVFYTDVALTAGKTIKSVTLPTAVTEGPLHVFAVSTKSGGTPNNIGTSDDSAPKQGSFDGTNSYSTQALQAVGITPGNPVISNGATFTWPVAASGTLNNYQANGQVLPVTPVAGATTLAFLGAANNGPSSGIGTITYTDNSVQTFLLGFSDWTLGGYGTDAPSFGNMVVATTPYRNTPGGASAAHKPVVFYTDVALTAGKTIKSVTLPTAITGGPLHVFAVSTKSGGTATPTPPVTPPPPPVAYNNTGTSDDSAPQLGSFDGARSYSTQALQNIGITPGGTVYFNQTNFSWPGSTAGTADNYVANGQVIPLSPVANANSLNFLGASSNGPTSGTATMNFTDGTSQTFTLGFSDWTLGYNGTDAPSFGNLVVATCPYRNTATGAETAHKPSIFFATVDIPDGKTLQSVALPSTATGGQLHVFSIGTSAS